MTFVLTMHGRVLARGTRAHVLDAAEERGLVEVVTLGAHTAEPVHVARIVERGVVVAVVAEEPELRRAA